MPSRLLVVEDDPNAAEFVCKGLRQEGFAVEHLAAGPDALHMALSEPFDLTFWTVTFRALTGYRF